MELIKARELAIELMEKHDLMISGWRFEFDNAKRRYGCCNYTNKRITLSRHLVELNSEENVTNVILHEIAHALTKGHGHDSVWRRKALSIGCDGNRCYKSDEVEKPKGNYKAVCCGCGREVYKFRAPKSKQSCGRCSRTFDPNLLLVFKKVA